MYKHRKTMYFYVCVTTGCNIDCRHCYARGYHSKNGNRVVKKDTLKKFVDLALKTLEYTESEAELIFHGGEPVSVGFSYLKELVETVSYARNRMKFVLQSNLIFRIENEFLNFIHKYFDGVLGTSFDPEIRRVMGSFDKFVSIWEENVKKVIEDKIFLSVNVTVTRKLLERFPDPSLLVSYFDNLGIREIVFGRYIKTGREEADVLSVSDDEFFSYMEKLLDFYMGYLNTFYRMKSSPDRMIFISPLDRMMVEAFRGSGYGCYSGKCFLEVITLMPDGRIFNCPEFAFKNLGKIGNISDLSPEVLTRSCMLNYVKIQKKVIDAAENCEFVHLCGRGCPGEPHMCSTDENKACRRFFKKITDVIKQPDKKMIIDFLHTYVGGQK